MPNKQQYDLTIVKMANEIADLLRNIPNDSFAFYKNESLIEDLSLAMARRAYSLGILSIDKTVFSKAWKSCEFLLFAEVFDHLIVRSGNRPDWLENALQGDSKSIYRHQISRFFHRYGNAEPQRYRRVYDLPSLFSTETSPFLIYWREEPDALWLKLFDDTHWRLTNLISVQADLPGVNSLVRTGLVKSLYLEDGSLIVAKRDNPDKPGRFVNEQKNIEEIVARLGLPDRESCLKINGNEVSIRVIRPFSVFSDKEANVLYSLSRYEGHPTLEAILLQEKDSVKRRQYLSKARMVLEHLYENGIIWGDMAPRNILVSEDKNETTFYLLDFEKTIFTVEAVPMALRLEHARGPMCVEEFGAVCSLQEVTECFSGYFDPDNWTYDDYGSIPYKKPKREVMDILAGMGNTNPTLGAYNMAEREMLEVRFPFTGHDGIVRLPLHTSFKIDHYLGAEYDRKTTESFMNARKCDLLDRVVDTLNNDLQRVENRLILAQFTSRLFEDGNGVEVSMEPSQLFSELRKAIDFIHECGSDRDRLLNIFGRLDIKEQFHRTRIQCKLQSPTMHVETKLNWKIIESLLHKFVKKQNPVLSVVTLHGGGARGEFSGGSDLDIAVISSGGDRTEAGHIEQEFVKFAQDTLGVTVELFPPLSFETLEEFIRSQPECFLDFSQSIVLCGPEFLSAKYREIVSKTIEDPRYISSVRTYFNSAHQEHPPTIKDMLKMALVADALGIGSPIPLYGALRAAECAESLNEDNGLVSTGADISWIMEQLVILRQKIGA
ncbi:nucleotidyltransferase domain-containing protein [Leptospirillum ferriphilum]|uniref:nucleotidyltransferase domain-containing protein n=1 Tax=Leptospirillum ferriphilum TaxID=178606 RepID=UPI0006B1710D|nr:nucleotidyltransferase domain-containing protein [Leptospirillum ferriphilum]